MPQFAGDFAVDHILFAVIVIVALQFLWQRMSAKKVTVGTEVDRIAALKQAAVARRAEYAAEREQDTESDASPPFGLLARRRMMEAEAAYAAALQAWENQQSRQKSR
jgi:hypothetical protein